MGSTHDFDDLIIGSGMAGLTVGSLLAARGRRVGILEAHDVPGGYAHTFSAGDYNFCAQVHYIFGCGEGEPIHRLLCRLGLDETVTFEHLDRTGYDHIVVDGERHPIPTGLDTYCEQLVGRYPEAEASLRGYFAVVEATGAELDDLPDGMGVHQIQAAPVRFRNLIRYRKWTLQQLFDSLKMPQRLQAVLAGQAGDYLLPPERVSLLLHVSMVTAYDSGAYYPTHHYSSLIDGLAASVSDRDGCAVLLNRTVTSLECDDGAVCSVVLEDGTRLTANRYVSNADPAMTMGLLSGPSRPEKEGHFDYAYSTSNITLYLGIKDLDLRDYGFGSYNVWHYPHDDINAIYRRQSDPHNDLSDPWLFMSTPTLHSNQPGIAPPGHQILEVATSCSYGWLADLAATDRSAYLKAKNRIRDRIFDVIEENYVPDLREHLTLKIAGTPLTNERFVRAPRGNAYGAELTWENTFPRVNQQSPVDNLWFANATAGFPSIGGTVVAGMALYERLEDDEV